MRTPNHLFKQTITKYSSTLDAYGKQVYSSPVNHQGRFTEKTMLIKDEKGEEVQTDAIVHLKSNVSVSIGDRLDYNSQAYEAKRIQETPDRLGNIRFIKIIVKQISV